MLQTRMTWVENRSDLLNRQALGQAMGCGSAVLSDVGVCAALTAVKILTQCSLH